MRNIFLSKITKRDFENFTVEELKILIKYEQIFLLNKKTAKKLEKIIVKNSLVENKKLISETLTEELPPTIVILNNLDTHAIKEKTIDIDFKENIINNLKNMNNLQLCVFLDKTMKFSKDYGINFLKNRAVSLHEINGAISKSLGLSLVFEIFKKGNTKKYLAIDRNKINKELLIDRISSQIKYHLYILEIVSREVLNTTETKALINGTKINRIIRTQIEDYVDIIKKEKEILEEVKKQKDKTWILTLEDLVNKLIDEGNDYYDEEEDYEL